MESFRTTYEAFLKQQTGAGVWRSFINKIYLIFRKILQNSANKTSDDIFFGKAASQKSSTLLKMYSIAAIFL